MPYYSDEEHEMHDRIWESIPEDDRKELSLMFSDWEHDFEYMDNRRIALVGNKEQEDFYNLCKERGCCGQYDTLKMCSSARQYRVGCNYGH
jgi:hypothetical protein